jgi:hypothetical protein
MSTELGPGSYDAHPMNAPISSRALPFQFQTPRPSAHCPATVAGPGTYNSTNPHTFSGSAALGTDFSKSVPRPGSAPVAGRIACGFVPPGLIEAERAAYFERYDPQSAKQGPTCATLASDTTCHCNSIAQGVANEAGGALQQECSDLRDVEDFIYEDKEDADESDNDDAWGPTTVGARSKNNLMVSQGPTDHQDVISGCQQKGVCVPPLSTFNALLQPQAPLQCSTKASTRHRHSNTGAQVAGNTDRPVSARGAHASAGSARPVDVHTLTPQKRFGAEAKLMQRPLSAPVSDALGVGLGASIRFERGAEPQDSGTGEAMALVWDTSRSHFSCAATKVCLPCAIRTGCAVSALQPCCCKDVLVRDKTERWILFPAQPNPTMGPIPPWARNLKVGGQGTSITQCLSHRRWNTY